MKLIFDKEYKENKDIEQIEEKMKEKFKEMIEDEDEAPNFWCILADLEWRYGVLTEEIKNKALEAIESGGDVGFWKEAFCEKDAKKRKKVLEKLEEKLKTPQPTKRRIPKKRPYVCKWNIGDVFAYKLTQKDSENTEYYGKYVTFQVVGKYKNIDENIMPYVHVYRKIFDKVPNINEIKALSCLIITEIYKYEKNIDLYELGFYSLERSKSFKKENLHYIGTKEVNKEISHDLKEFGKEESYYGEEIYWHFFDYNIIKLFKINEKKDNIYINFPRMEIYQNKLYYDKISEKIRGDYKKLFAKDVDVNSIKNILHEKYIEELNNDEDRYKKIINDNIYRSNVMNEIDEKEMLKYIEKEELIRNKELKKENNILSNAKIGDIFAYKLSAEEFRETKYYNKYIIIKKHLNYTNYINEQKPQIRIYEKVFDYIPKIEEVETFEGIKKKYKEESVGLKVYPLPIFMQKGRFFFKSGYVNYELYINMENKDISKEKIFEIGNLIQRRYIKSNYTCKEFIPEIVNIENFDIYIKELLEYNNIVKEKIKNDNIDICSTL